MRIARHELRPSSAPGHRHSLDKMKRTEAAAAAEALCRPDALQYSNCVQAVDMEIVDNSKACVH